MSPLLVTRSIKTLWPDASVTDIQGVMELRGMKKAEQSEVLEHLGLATGSALAGAGAGMRNIVSRFQTGATALTENLKGAARK